MLKGKNAVIYEVSDSPGGAVGIAFEAHGATVYITARRIENAEKIANEIKAAVGTEIPA